MNNNAFDANSSENILTTPCKVIYYNNLIMKRNKYYNMLNITDKELYEFNQYLKSNFEIIMNKDSAGKYTDTLYNCFEYSCYILYDREISKEVIDRQKTYGDEYVIDFLKYILRMFFKRYDESYVLSKEQSSDIKNLCRELFLINKSEYFDKLVFKLSGKEIIECIKRSCIVQ